MREGPGAAAAMLCSVVGAGGTGGGGSPRCRWEKKGESWETKKLRSAGADGSGAGAGDVILAFGFSPNEAEAGNGDGRLLWSCGTDGQGFAEFGELQELNRLECVNIKILEIPENSARVIKELIG